jgi:nucleoside-diphosphate-sugar epimerase
LTPSFDVRVLVRDDAKAGELAEIGATPMIGDLRSGADRERAVAGVDAVVHLAAAFRGVANDEMAAVNDDATVGLADAATAAGVDRFVFTSTNLVYGPGRDRPAREDDEPRPAAEAGYPASKVRAERQLLERSRGLRILRLAFVYGEGDPHLAEAPGFLAAQGWPGHKRLHMVHHADVGQAVVRALLTDGIDGMTFNVADDAPVTCYEIHTVNREPHADQLPDHADPDPWEGIVDTTRARERLGFRPIYPSLYTAVAAGAL